MSDKDVIARRVAQELKDGDRVNLGIGLPTLVASTCRRVQVHFHSENGIFGMSPLPGEGFEDRNLTDAGGRPVGAMPGACAFDSAFSFGVIRGGHLDVTVLGGLEVDEAGPARELDGAGQDDSRHGWRDGSGDRGAPRHRGDDAPLAHRLEDRQALQPADHLGAAGGSGGDGAGGDPPDRPYTRQLREGPRFTANPRADLGHPSGHLHRKRAVAVRLSPERPQRQAGVRSDEPKSEGNRPIPGHHESGRALPVRGDDERPEHRQQHHPRMVRHVAEGQEHRNGRHDPAHPRA